MQDSQTHPTPCLRTLKTEDYLLIAQQAKHYQQLASTLQQQEKLLSQQVKKLQHELAITHNKKEEYRIRCNELTVKVQEF